MSEVGTVDYYKRLWEKARVENENTLAENIRLKDIIDKAYNKAARIDAAISLNSCLIDSLACDLNLHKEEQAKEFDEI